MERNSPTCPPPVEKNRPTGPPPGMIFLCPRCLNGVLYCRAPGLPHGWYCMSCGHTCGQGFAYRFVQPAPEDDRVGGRAMKTITFPDGTRREEGLRLIVTSGLVEYTGAPGVFRVPDYVVTLLEQHGIPYAETNGIIKWLDLGPVP